MKRFLKIVSLLSLVCLLLPTLCGCFVVDELRESQAFYGENNDIIWNGTIYKRLPYTNNLCIGDTIYNVNVTDNDVPTLLQEEYKRQELVADKEKMFLENVYYINDGEYYETLGSVYYCREDRYEEFYQRIRNGFKTDVLCYEYYAPDPETGEYTEQRFILTKEQKAVLERITQTQDPVSVGRDWDIVVDYEIELDARSEDMFFRRDGMDISVRGSTYYVKDGMKIYEVPEEDAPIVKEIMAEYIKDY